GSLSSQIKHSPGNPGRFIAVAIEHYNETHPHSALGYLSPREYRRQRVTST
ncbi:transposase, partial [Escherichia coli]